MYRAEVRRIPGSPQSTSGIPLRPEGGPLLGGEGPSLGSVLREPLAVKDGGIKELPMDTSEQTPRRSPMRWKLAISPKPQNRAEARDAIMDCLYRAMDIAALAFRGVPDHTSAFETIEDLVTEASVLLHDWFDAARQEGQP